MQSAIFIALIVFCVLAMVAIVLIIVAFSLVVPLFRKHLIMLNMVESDVVISKGQRERIMSIVRQAYAEAVRTAELAKQAATAVASEVKQAVEKVPEAVIQKMQEGSSKSWDSVFPTPPPPTGTKSPPKKPKLPELPPEDEE